MVHSKRDWVTRAAPGIPVGVKQSNVNAAAIAAISSAEHKSTGLFRDSGDTRKSPSLSVFTLLY